MSNDPMPAVVPDTTGMNAHQAAAARQESFAALTAWYSRNGSAPAPSAPRQPVAPAPNNSLQEFDREMRAAGIQRSDNVTAEIDQRALKFLDDLAKSTPVSERNKGNWFKTWCKDREEVLSGRRYGETTEQWQARRSGTAPDGAPAADTGADEIVGVDSAHFTVAEHGYTLPSCPEGVEVDRAAAEGMLAVARQAGIPQAAVDAFFNQLAKQTAAGAK
ncbi:MAG: hypothetical protein ACREXP_10785 [Steroidobacteraceae bacterium]